MRWPAFLKRTVVRHVMVMDQDLRCRWCELKVLPGEGFEVHHAYNIFGTDPPKALYAHVNLFVCVNRLRGASDAASAAEAMMREMERRS